MLIRCLAATLRITLEDPSNVTSATQNPNFLFAFWHNRILLMPYIYERFFSDRRIIVMISTSRDGQWIADIAKQFGIDAARGSSSKKGVRALLHITKELKKEALHLGVTPDGPRGPKYSIQPGVFAIAQHGHIRILPLSLDFKNKWELKSWDGFQIPKPFSECRFIVGHPIEVPYDSTDKTGIEAVKKQLTEALGS